MAIYLALQRACDQDHYSVVFGVLAIDAPNLSGCLLETHSLYTLADVLQYAQVQVKPEARRPVFCQSMYV